jgi:hypothetical protein
MGFRSNKSKGKTIKKGVRFAVFDTIVSPKRHFGRGCFYLIADLRGGLLKNRDHWEGIIGSGRPENHEAIQTDLFLGALRASDF